MQADPDSCWQMINYKVNDILYGSQGASQHPITQPLQPSKLLNNKGTAPTGTAGGLWKAAKCVPTPEPFSGSYEAPLASIAEDEYNHTSPAFQNFKNM